MAVLIFIIIYLVSGIAIYNGSRWINFQRHNIWKLKGTRDLQYATHIRDGKQYDLTHDTLKFDSPNNPFVIYWGLRGYTYKYPSSLAAYTIGQSDLFPYYNMLVGVDKQNLIIEEEIQNPLNQFVGKLDLSFFIVYLLPVFIIVIAFDVLSSERESGTIKLLQTQGTTLFRIIVSKIILRFIFISVVTLFSILFWSVFFEPALFSGSNYFLLLISLSSMLLYIAFWFLLCFLINSFDRNSIVNSLTLISSWIIFLFIIPSVLNGFAQKWYPIPSRNVQTLQDREMDNLVEKDSKKILASYLTAHPQHKKIHADTSGKIAWMDQYFEMLAKEMEKDKQTNPLELRILSATNNQQRLTDKWRFLSPSLLMMNTFLQTSETSVYDQLDYALSFELFNARWRAFTRDKIFRIEKFTDADFSKLPLFQVTKIYSRFACRDYFLNTLGLSFFGSLFLLVAYYNFKKNYSING
jgi:ABC-2 type transport system permease protein